ncbi:MAG: class II aldolase/adducin family protein [Deltaproteobacteria bacterium]|nr:class II aldolase/adducin family protein [Deltaproteobacteria bacterium]
MTSLHALKRRVSEYSRLLHAQAWVANHDGNVSARLDGEAGFLITPTGISKRLCDPETIVVCDSAGEPRGAGRAPSEVALHVGAYRARPDVRAVIHAHPPHASAFALAQRRIDPVAMPEVVVSLGDRIPLVPLFLPRDPGVAAAIADALSVADVALLAGNGVITAGVDLEQAFLRLELVEHYARILALTGGIGGPVALDGAQTQRLLEMRKKAGLGPLTGNAPSEPRGALAQRVRPLVAEEVRRMLGGSK